MSLNRLPQEIIRRKRDGHPLEPEELAFMVQGLVDGSISEGQVAAFAMAVYFQGLNLTERVALTQAMTHSGAILDWSALNLSGPVLDKHSTGGVGDKVSLILAPLVAACGAYVPMIAGRGLGHTGGTLDKLDSIPGYNSTPDLTRFGQVVKAVGCAMIGQTAELAPADRRFYAIRDVTATVESIGLITASILSKKLAEGLDALVLDVKTGSGAFMTTLAESQTLAESLVTVAQGAGLPAVALITAMDQVLGRTAGHALEVREAIAYLNGSVREPRLNKVVLALGEEMLRLGGLASEDGEARTKLEAALNSGQAAERFAAMVHALGGPGDLLAYPDRYMPQTPVIRAAPPTVAGFVSQMDTRAIGITLVEMGGGRRRASDDIDYAVGLSEVCQVGEWVDQHRPLAWVHARSEEQAATTVRALQAALTVAEEAPPARPVVYAKLSRS